MMNVVLFHDIPDADLNPHEIKKTEAVAVMNFLGTYTLGVSRQRRI